MIKNMLDRYVKCQLSGNFQCFQACNIAYTRQVWILTCNTFEKVDHLFQIDEQDLPSQQDSPSRTV